MTRELTRSDDQIIAMLLGDAPASPALNAWLRSPAGRHELAAYRRALGAFTRIYGAIRAPRPRPTAYYCAISSPIGRVLVAATEAGVVRVSFRRSEASFVSELRERLALEVLPSPTRTARIVHQLRAYFAGERRRFDIAIDFRHVTAFQRRVLLAAAQVPAGQVVSYGEIARRIGRSGGSRAVGQALRHNPVPIVIPCHRVVATGGTLGGYTGGLEIKRKLLRIEGALAQTG
jgi:methylated-DNA-[protein]-cysteine S-methyltransferase